MIPDSDTQIDAVAEAEAVADKTVEKYWIQPHFDGPL